jgi:glycosyltransferase involved in cell wall biosynthesis
MGIRGIPAAHGGFETFAERLALYLVERGWKVTVYCQGSATGKRAIDVWQGVTRIHIPVKRVGSVGSIEFDIKATFDVLRIRGTILTLGYNTGFLCLLLAAKSRTNFINMDGIEWKRAKYGLTSKAYLWLNERIAAWSGTHLVADHPKIADHLATRVVRDKIKVIPYGAPEIRNADASFLVDYGVEPGNFLTVIARAEPENSILEIVRGFSAKSRGMKLVVLGAYADEHPYQRQVRAEASADVIFPGAIYDTARVQALRGFSRAYIHGHQVGGTNPSLVEALAAGNAIIAHDNPFNRWVAGKAGVYFANAAGVAARLDEMQADPGQQKLMSQAARARWAEAFTWPDILDQYRSLLESK